MTAWMTPTPPLPLLVDPAPAGGLDLDRLERALELTAERVGQGRYRVKGGAQDHWVDLFSAAHPRCDCGDHLWREAVCKHILAALLREGDPRVVAGVGRVMSRLRERISVAKQAA
ncbi:SWIM zinc finger family protein [Roseisolibacter sp. H3M3-2]|uniref:SWIM zinc finger family protein n=1 Tax=Roseisolibacter sp. H3M3-2 TaxID=3031323 RepID=UPI0023DB5B9E|nr:SWIM zinc finger family protein [Roseisolibacter sp. H3M3-2]MDF1502605.1 SWIM zinc finger domain-containing protein [Roseisolibacter sp. H3M3-2]